MTLTESGLKVTRKSLDDGAVTSAHGAHRESIIKLLNDSLATELVCVLRYKRHHFMASGLASPKITEEFMVQANEESNHANPIAKRIVQLGGEPDFSPSTLLERSYADYDECNELKTMIGVNLVAERMAVESYRQMIALIGGIDNTSRRLLEDILAEEEEHADELADWLED